MLRTGKRPIRLLDVGSGAGFPGLPLKLARPQVEVKLLDALAKRLKFIGRGFTSVLAWLVKLAYNCPAPKKR